MFKIYFRYAMIASLGAALILYPPGCSSKIEEPTFTLRTDSGPLAWKTGENVTLKEGTYQDRSETRRSVLIEAGPGRFELNSGPLATASGRTLAFTFPLKFEAAGGLLIEARMKLLDESGNLLADSLLYRVSSGGRRGMTRDWISYTRVLKMPSGTASAVVEVSSEVEKGRVWLGEMALVGGEDWLGYAASFSSHLGRRPEDKYIYTAGRFVEPGPDPTPTDKETRAGLLFFERKGLVGAWPYAVPRPGDRVEIMRETVPASAVAPFAFGVKALEDISSVEVKLGGPLIGETGALETEPRLYQARYAANRLGSSWGKEFGIRARMLTPLELKPLSRGEVRYFWLDVPLPQHTGPGAYRGLLSIEAAGHPALEVPFRIDVPPLVLPPLGDEHVVGMYYYPPEDPVLIEAQLKDMAAHGVYAVSLSGSFVKKDPERGAIIDYERVARLNRLMILMKKHGFFRPTSLYVSDLFRKLDLPRNAGQWEETHKRLYERAIRLMDNIAKRWGWCELMFFPVDEPANDPEEMKLAELTLGILRGMDGIKVLCDLNTEKSVLGLSQYLDAVCMQISSVSPETVGAMKEKNVETFMYLPAFGSSDVGHDAAYHRAIPGWFLPACGIKGIYYFAYQSVAGDPYDELDGSHRDWCAAYPAPGPEIVWPSPEWQGIRRGIEDLRLVELARGLSIRGSASEDYDIRRLARRVSDKLDDILETVAPGGSSVIYQLHHELDTYVAEKWRQELMGEVIALQEALQE